MAKRNPVCIATHTNGDRRETEPARWEEEPKENSTEGTSWRMCFDRMMVSAGWAHLRGTSQNDWPPRSGARGTWPQWLQALGPLDMTVAARQCDSSWVRSPSLLWPRRGWTASPQQEIAKLGSRRSLGELSGPGPAKPWQWRHAQQSYIPEAHWVSWVGGRTLVLSE